MLRRVLGGTRLAAGILLAGTLVYQITDLAIGGGLIPSHYFLFFTVDSTIIEIVVLALAGLSALRREVDSSAITVVAMAVVPYAVITCAVYNLLLRGGTSTTYTGQDWHNEVVHVAGPIYLALDWFVLRLADAGRPRLRFASIGWVLVFPLVWLAVTLVRGGIDAYYPYPFLDPAGSGGVAGVVEYIVGLALAMVALGLLGILVTRARARTLTPGRRSDPTPVAHP